MGPYRTVGKGRRLNNRHRFDCTPTFYPALFQGGQGITVEVLREFGLKLKALKFLHLGVQPIAAAVTGQLGPLLRNLLVDRGDLLTYLDQRRVIVDQICAHRGKLYLQFRTAGLQAADDRADRLCRLFRRNQAVAILIARDFLARLHGTVTQSLDLRFEKRDLFKRKILRKLIHELTAIGNHALRYFMREFGVESFGSDDDDAVIFVVFNADAVQIVFVQIFIRTPEPEPRDRIDPSLRPVVSQADLPVELLHHPDRQEVVSQQELVAGVPRAAVH